MKVVHLVLSLQPGGLESVVCNLAGFTAAEGLDTSVCCLDERGAFASRLEAERVPMDVVARRPGWDPSLVIRLAAYLRRVRADVVHTHGLDPMLYGALAARLARVPRVIHTQHHTMLERSGTVDRLKFRLAAMLCDVIVAVTGETARMARGCGARIAQLVTVPNGVDCQRFSPLPERMRRSREHGVVRFGTVARLSPEKGVDVLLRAFAEVRRTVSTAELCVVGDGPSRLNLERLAHELGLGLNVRFAGHQDHVERWFSRWDAFVLPSLTEGMPVALLEAMASGLPVIASRVGGVPDVVEQGHSGLLVAAGDPGALASAMTALANGDTRGALGAAGRKAATARFSVETMVAAYRRLYDPDGTTGAVRSLVKRQMRRLMPRRLVMWTAPASRAEAALTFDDGPDPEFTPAILGILKERGVRATFFLIGDKARRESAIVDRILADGHEIANHSYTHPEFSGLGWRGSCREIDSAERALHAGGWPSRAMFRPPRGRMTVSGLLAAWVRRLTVVLWSVDLKDFSATDRIQVLTRLKARPLVPGDIILYHGRCDAALAALPGVIDMAMGAGLKLVPVSTMGGAR